MTRDELVDRLRAQRPEIESALLTRATAISVGPLGDDPEYLHGFRAAVSASLDYGLAVIGAGQRERPLVPAAVLSQARLAARHGVGLDTVLRRYIAGSATLDHHILKEADQQQWQSIIEIRTSGLEHLLSEVTIEYEREERNRAASRRAATLRRVQRLLDCETQSDPALEYDLEVHHVGLASEGDGADKAIRALAATLDASLLLVHHGDEGVWAWLGRREPIGRERLTQVATSDWPAELRLAIGEARDGTVGWRLTHRQAKAALPVASQVGSVVHYGDVCLLASMLRDDLLATSLRSTYIEPLVDRAGSATYIETLRAYFATNRNGASAAAALGVSRQTVNNRLRTIEGLLDQPLTNCAAALELALHADALHRRSL